MKKSTFGIGFALLVLSIVLVFQECLAGVVIDQVMKDREGMSSRVTLYFSGERLRTDDVDHGLSTIMDFKGDRMVMVDHRAKNYIEVRFSQREKEVGEQLKKGLPAVRPKMRRIVVRRAGETATINGFRTEKVEVFADGERIEENWVTRDVDMSEIEKVMERVSKGFSMEFRNQVAEGREIYEKLKPYGFPIVVKDYAIIDGSEGLSVVEVKKLEQKELNEELFLPPKGYERVLVP
ncbi:MAG: DUF4412 domain-containing protein [Deltaproteobacteria bacterium]